MYSISVQQDIQQVFDKLRKDLRRQVPFAASRAINETAFDTREFIKDQMDRMYDGGAVRYTKNAILSTKSTKRKLWADIYISDKDKHRMNYILNTIEGGEIPKYKTAVFSPNKDVIRVTKVGRNMPRGFVKRNVAKPSHFIHHATDRSSSATGKQMPSGLYRRIGKGKNQKIQLLVAFDDNQVNKPSFPIRLPARKFVQKTFGPSLFRYLKQAIRTAK